MQYFQKANSKQIVGHAATAANGGVDDPARTGDRAGATLRATSAMARATSILCMTVSFEGHALTARRRLLPDRYGNGRQLPTPAAGLLTAWRALKADLPKDSVANASQIVALDKTILSERVGKLSAAKVELLLSGIDVVLGR